MRVLVLFASKHGHTRAIAEFLGAKLTDRGFTVDVRDVESPGAPALDTYGAAIIASPVHLRKHSKRIVAFARAERDRLTTMPSVFLSVSLTQATVENPRAAAEMRTQAEHDLSVVVGDFIETTGWHPKTTLRVAGRLAYTRYGWLVKWVMKRIARQAGGSQDTTKDHVYTDWAALERFAAGFAQRLARAETAEAAVPR